MRKPLRSLILSLLVTFAIWLVFTWPLPRHLTTGITMSSRNVEKDSVRTMIRGDHLQLLYHFWLFHDTLKGGTPPFLNPYEFNTGDDEGRFEPNTYFLPFSLVYAAGASLAGRAFGWNLAVFVSLWMTYLVTVQLLRRYGGGRAFAWVAALAALMLPYRWITLLGGSPTGFAMVFVPLLLLGLDKAVRDGSASGGLVAGSAVFLACLSDTHVFFFCLLLMPPWSLAALSMRPRGSRVSRPALAETARALLPALLLALAAVVFSQYEAGSRLAASLMAGGRTMKEILVFTPGPGGILGSDRSALSNQVFLGYGALGILAALLLCAAGSLRARAGRRPGETVVMVALAVIVAAAVAAALGPLGPFQGLLFRLARKIVPHYDMIRQPAKIFSIMPTMVALAALMAGACLGRGRLRRFSLPLLCLAVAAMFFECRAQVSATISLLDTEQPAYRSVAGDAAAAGVVPRALVIPLWPGDSHESAAYQHYASLYHIRMVNGYSPVVGNDYFEKVFKRFESVNQGSLEDEQVAALRGMGVGYLLLHEDAFPEKVSPFPVAFTLGRLLEHPRLELLSASGGVWAFRIAGEAPFPSKRPPSLTCQAPFPARRYEAEESPREGVLIVEDPLASNGHYIRMESPGASLSLPFTATAAAPSLRWMIRARGPGDAEAVQDAGETSRLGLDSRSWQWRAVPVDLGRDYGTASLRISSLAEGPQIDVVLLAAGEWPSLVAGGSLFLPAACFFHAGYTDLERGSVTLRADRDPEAIVFYGPKLPFEAGRYDVEILYRSGAAEGTELGRFNVRRRERDESGWVPVVQGRRAAASFTQESAIPVFVAFLFTRNGDVEISGVRFERTR